MSAASAAQRALTMAGSIPTASCGCVSSEAVCCSVPHCPVSGCPTCAVEGRNEVFLGEGALGAPPGPVVPGPVSIAFDAFAHCAGLSAVGERCAKWICGGHVEGGAWISCDGCEDFFCGACRDMLWCAACYKTLCTKCNAKGTIFVCTECQEGYCRDHDEIVTCACGKTYCDSDCGINSGGNYCEDCCAFFCSERMKSEPPPVVSCSGCDDSTFCAPCWAKGKGYSACDGCGRAYCAHSECQARLVGHCGACKTQCCARCTCATCAATLCACAPESTTMAKCAQCRQRNCTVCLDPAACCGRVLCAACGEGGVCGECGKSTCAACSDRGTHEGCSSKRSKVAE